MKTETETEREIDQSHSLSLSLSLSFLLLLLAACGKPDVAGTVLPVEAERTGLPWQQVNVRLVRGVLMEQLSPLAAKHRQEAEAVARTRVLTAAKQVRTAKADVAQHARKMLDPAAGDEALGPCLPSAEARLADARRAYRTAMSDLAPRIAAWGLSANRPEEVIARLRATIRAKVNGEARRLRDEYLATQLTQRSGIVLAAGSLMDRLCWTVQNNRGAAVRFRGLTILYNGRELPAPVAAQLWRLPPRDNTLRIPGSQGVNNDLLAPGAQYQACFYATRAAVPVDVLNRYGLSTENPNRTGDWRVRWDEIELVGESPAGVGQTAVTTVRAPDTLATAFADQLHQFEAQLEERSLLDAMHSSASARSVANAEAALVACHRAIAADKALREEERVIQAIEAGKTDDPAVQSRVRPIVQALLGEPARIAQWVGEANAALDRSTVARQEQNLGAAYHFENLEPGQYTLVATSTDEQPQPKIWLVPLDVKERLDLDLVAANAREKALRQTFEDVLFGAHVL